MTRSSLTAETRLSNQYSSRQGVVPTVLQLHHGATTNSDWMVSVMVSGDKQVSANYVCRVNGQLVNVVDEIYRAWTSASGLWDRKSITVETTNLSTNGWTISDASHEALAQLAADCSKRYGWGKLNRSGPFSTWNVIGHREINEYTGESYGTACPGGMDLDRIVRRANQILNNNEEDLSIMDAETRSYLDNRFGALESRLDRVEATVNDGDHDHDNIGRVISDARDAIIGVVTREGRGGRAFRKESTGETVVISERGPWCLDLRGDSNPDVALGNLTARGWCQDGVKLQNDNDFAFTLRQYDRIAKASGLLSDALVSVAYPEGHRPS